MSTSEISGLPAGSPSRVAPRTGIAAILIFAAAPALAAVLEVTPSGSGPWPTIQAAIDAAAPGDTIQLASGRFAGAGNRDLDPLGKPLLIRSAGGDAAACVIDCEGSISHPHRGFIFHSGEDSTTIVRGIWIINGFADGSDGGGAILLRGEAGMGTTAPRIENCRLQWNRSAVGAAIRAIGHGARVGLVLVGCDVLNNSGSPAISVSGSNEDTCLLTGCRLEANGEGALAVHWECVRLRTESCAFLNNGAWALSYWGEGGVEVFDCLFAGNAAAAFLLNGNDREILIDRCRIKDNGRGLIADGVVRVERTEVTGNYSDGLELRERSCRVNASRITGNAGAGIRVSWGYRAEIDSCLVADNAGDGLLLDETSGGDLRLGGSTLVRNGLAGVRLAAGPGPGAARLAGCTISHNTGPGLVHQTAVPRTVELDRCLVTFNGGASVLCDPDRVPALSCCDLFGNEADWPACIADQAEAAGNFSADPLYCGERALDFHLATGSPAAPASGGPCGQVGAWPAGCTATEEARDRPPSAAHLSCAPNPFNPRVEIRCRVPAGRPAAGVAVYDPTGRKIATLHAGPLPPGEHRLQWDGRDGRGAATPAGVYLVRLELAGGAVTAKVVQVR